MALREKPPCTQDCPRRNGECHASCPDYAKWSAKNEEHRNKMAEIKKYEDDATVLLMKRIRRSQKMNKHGGHWNGKDPD